MATRSQKQPEQLPTVYPLIFSIAVAEIDDNEKERLYSLIYSYLVRRAVYGLTPKNLNKTFPRVVGFMLENGVSCTTFAGAFADQTGPTVRFPSDAEFSEAVENRPLYLTILRKDRLQDILWELELASRSKFSVGTARPVGMSIEHILPISWTTHWPLPDGRSAPDDGVTGADEAMLTAIAARRAALHTLGNLTLVTVPGNSAASNSGFMEKADWLKKSLLALNLEILERPTWGEAEIKERGGLLAMRATQIWPNIAAP